ncbi:hypothetical protein EV361DRAFT_893309 [Lentinula raphanica]|nr:hypothetical protein EV361DRAFT_893309 [Lentinula raphanica]
MLCAPLDNEQSQPDELYLERFEAFMEKSVMDIRAFAEREARSFEQTRQDVARWHCNKLFQWQAPSSESPNRSTEIWTILVNLSRILESLSSVFGIETFLLAVDPEDTSSQSFLGGSVRGREFWRGMRTGGESGARMFRELCLKHKDLKNLQSNDSSQRTPSDNTTTNSASTSSVVNVSSKQSARNIKVDLYDGVRKALRLVSGIRNAEMKWTSHERLFTYGVYLEGWPSDIPYKNPSTLKAEQNKRLLDLLNKGTLRFVKNVMLPSGSGQEHNDDVEEETESTADNDKGDIDQSDEMFDWAIQFDEDRTNVTQSPDAGTQTAHEDVAVEPSLDVARPRKRAKYGERIRFHSSEDAIT